MITKIDLKKKKIVSYGIRKLTPRECFRLMGCREDIIDTMQTKEKKLRKVADPDTGEKTEREVEEYVVSQSQQYRQAGNSIVVDMLIAVFNQLFYPEKRKGEGLIKSDDASKADVLISVADDGQMSFF